MKTKYILEVSFDHDPEFMRAIAAKAALWVIDGKARCRRVITRKKTAKRPKTAPKANRDRFGGL